MGNKSTKRLVVRPQDSASTGRGDAKSSKVRAACASGRSTISNDSSTGVLSGLNPMFQPEISNIEKSEDLSENFTPIGDFSS